MVSVCLSNEEKDLLKSLIGKTLIKYRHDPLDKFDEEAVYGRIEFFFDESIILVDYDYDLFPLFGSKDDERPRFSVKVIAEGEAVSALKDVTQINVRCGKVLSGITLVEDRVDIEWNGKKDSYRIDKAIIIKFEDGEMAIQGDYMMPLIDIIKGEEVATKLLKPGDEYENHPEVKYQAERIFIDL